MKRVIKLVLIIAALLATTVAKAQDDVTLTVSGEGSTKEEATTNALRSAIEQTYGVFVSSDLSLMNESVVRDEIATLAKGNVKSFVELSSVQKADNDWFVTLKATVSPSNLIEYTKAHGGSVEFAGGLFAQSMKLIDLNTKNEKIAMDNLYHQLISLLPKMFYYTIENLQEPKIEDVRIRKEDNSFEISKERYYSIDADFVIRNNVYNQEFYNALNSTLKSLALTEDEQKMYKSRNIPMYSFGIYDNYEDYGRYDLCAEYTLRNEINYSAFGIVSNSIEGGSYQCDYKAKLVELSMCRFSVVAEQNDGSEIVFSPYPCELYSEADLRHIYYRAKDFDSYKEEYRESKTPPRIVLLPERVFPGYQAAFLIKGSKDFAGYIYDDYKHNRNYEFQFSKLFWNGRYDTGMHLSYSGGKWNSFNVPGSVFAKCRIKLSFSEAELAKIKSIKVVSDHHQAIMPK